MKTRGMTVMYDESKERTFVQVLRKFGDPAGTDPVVVTIQWQHGPVKEAGVNGVQVDDVLELCVDRLRGLNAKFPCRENELAIERTVEAIAWLERRTRDREERGVEGTNRA
jgi:hypothetical protein